MRFPVRLFELRYMEKAKLAVWAAHMTQAAPPQIELQIC